MGRGKIKKLKIVSKDDKVEFQNWYIESPTIGSPFPEYNSNLTWDKWGGNPFGADGKLYSEVSDEIKF